MKLNWGTSIVIAFGLFMSFILFFVVKVQTNSKYDNELVVKEYYKHDATFGNELAMMQRTHELKQQPVVTKTEEGIQIQFPASYNASNTKGIVSLYRSSNQKLDFEVPISLSGSTLLIPKKSLVGGRWDINMDWQYEGKSYLTKETIYIN